MGIRITEVVPNCDSRRLFAMILNRASLLQRRNFCFAMQIFRSEKVESQEAKSKLTTTMPHDAKTLVNPSRKMGKCYWLLRKFSLRNNIYCGIKEIGTYSRWMNVQHFPLYCDRFFFFIKNSRYSSTFNSNFLSIAIGILSLHSVYSKIVEFHI